MSESGVDRSGAVCYPSRCAGEPTHRVRWERGERWYGICEDCAEGIPLGRGTVLEGLPPETITAHPAATDGGADSAGSDRYADGDTPDTKDENECAGEGCGAFVLTNEEYCMGCSGEVNRSTESGSDNS